MALREEVIRIGTRGSGLALIQAQQAFHILSEAFPERRCEIVTIKTTADVRSDEPLARLGKGMFVRELDRALLDGDIDMAVHSMKDVPTELPEGLVIGAALKRADPRDALVDRWGVGLRELPPGATIGTSSPRRAAQIKSVRSDLDVQDIRGNVDTRLRKAKGDGYDGAILAVSGLMRMGLEGEISEHLSPEEFVPAPGQGALAVEVRDGDTGMDDLMSALNDPDSRIAVETERRFLEELGGGCRTPAGAYAWTEAGLVNLSVFLSTPDASRVFRTTVSGPADHPQYVARLAHRKLMDQGAADLVNDDGGS